MELHIFNWTMMVEGEGHVRLQLGCILFTPCPFRMGASLPTGHSHLLGRDCGWEQRGRKCEFLVASRVTLFDDLCRFEVKHHSDISSWQPTWRSAASLEGQGLQFPGTLFLRWSFCGADPGWRVAWPESWGFARGDKRLGGLSSIASYFVWDSWSILEPE